MGATKRRARSAISQVVVMDGREHLLVVVPLNQAVESLSPAERAVAEAAALGRTSEEIARERRVSKRTIANQLASIFRKLGVGSRAELVYRLASR